jgi:hypothetical protein
MVGREKGGLGEKRMSGRGREREKRKLGQGKLFIFWPVDPENFLALGGFLA